MSLIRRVATTGSSRHRWLVAVIALVVAATVLFVLTQPIQVPAAEPVSPLSTVPAPRSSAAPSSGVLPESPSPTPAIEGVDRDGAPRTTDFRNFASAAAIAIYTWDTRTASYSEVYSRLRGWWHVLPDGSNPLGVFVQEFEATGINAGTYPYLAGQQAYRTAAAESLLCDNALAKVRERPAPWLGLHVCTVSLRVVDQSSAGRNAYPTTVSVMVNCPPAATAPADRCVMVGFYAAPNRVVY